MQWKSCRSRLYILNNAVISAQFVCAMCICVDEFHERERKTFNLCHDIKLQSRWNSANKWLIQPILLNKSHCFQMMDFFFVLSRNVTDAMFEKIKTIGFFSVLLRSKLNIFLLTGMKSSHILCIFFTATTTIWYCCRQRQIFSTRINYACDVGAVAAKATSSRFCRI